MSDEKNEVALRTGSHGLVLQTLDQMQRWAEGVKASGLAPKSLDSTSRILVATQYGLELGLTPMAALNSIYVYNGTPTLFGDAALAIVKASDKCEYVHESISGEGDDRVAQVISLRKGDSQTVDTTFSVKDAEVAGLWGKKGPWTTHPDRMLKYKARAFNLIDKKTELLMGLHIAEEMVGEEELLPVPDCETPPREHRRKKVDATVSEPETKDTVELSLYEQVLHEFNWREGAAKYGSFKAFAVETLVIEPEELEARLEDPDTLKFLQREIEAKMPEVTE